MGVATEDGIRLEWVVAILSPWRPGLDGGARCTKLFAERHRESWVVLRDASVFVMESAHARNGDDVVACTLGH